MVDCEPRGAATDHHRPSTPEALRRRDLLTKVTLGGVAAIGILLGVPIVGHLLGPLLRPAPNEWRTVIKIDQSTGGQSALISGAVAGSTPLHADQLAVGDTILVAFREPSSLPWAGQTALTAAYLRRESAQRLIAFAVNCAHLGCPVNWQPHAQLFLCPCHGGVYYADGTVAAGPPPRPLFQYDTRVRNGEVELRTRPLPVV